MGYGRIAKPQPSVSLPMGVELPWGQMRDIAFRHLVLAKWLMDRNALISARGEL
jgi:hypothetical protein